MKEDIQKLIDSVTMGELADNPTLVDFITRLERILKWDKFMVRYPEYEEYLQ